MNEKVSIPCSCGCEVALEVSAFAQDIPQAISIAMSKPKKRGKPVCVAIVVDNTDDLDRLVATLQELRGGLVEKRPQYTRWACPICGAGIGFDRKCMECDYVEPRG